MINRTNEINYNKFGSKMIISKYINDNDIDVYFQEYDWTFEHANIKEFERGLLRCPYEKRTYGVGYLGEGKYKATKNGLLTRCYQTWSNMMKRGYSKEFKDKQPTYQNVTVCEEWHNFQNFAKWYYNNIYKVNNERMELDKDILVHGNKIYSPKTCIFVPQRINSLFTKCDKRRGEYPIGVSYDEDKDELVSRCSIIVNGKKIKIELGRFEPYQEKQAFQCYKKFKENYIKQVAEEYKELIPEKLYQALINYEVEIDD